MTCGGWAVRVGGGDGFIGAGLIVRGYSGVRGITAAVNIWTSAGICPTVALVVKITATAMILTTVALLEAS